MSGQKRGREGSDGEKNSWKTPTVRSEKKTGCEQPQQLFCLWNKPGDEGVSTGRKRREREREWVKAESEGRESQAGNMRGPVSSQRESLMHLEPLYKYHKEWMMSRGRGERRGRNRERPLQKDGVRRFMWRNRRRNRWSDWVRAMEKQDQLGGLSQRKQLRGDTSGPPPLSKSYKTIRQNAEWEDAPRWPACI